MVIYDNKNREKIKYLNTFTDVFSFFSYHDGYLTKTDVYPEYFEKPTNDKLIGAVTQYFFVTKYKTDENDKIIRKISDLSFGNKYCLIIIYDENEKELYNLRYDLNQETSLEKKNFYKDNNEISIIKTEGYVENTVGIKYTIKEEILNNFLNKINYGKQQRTQKKR